MTQIKPPPRPFFPDPKIPGRSLKWLYDIDEWSVCEVHFPGSSEDRKFVWVHKESMSDYYNFGND